MMRDGPLCYLIAGDNVYRHTCSNRALNLNADGVSKGFACVRLETMSATISELSAKTWPRIYLPGTSTLLADRGASVA